MFELIDNFEPPQIDFQSNMAWKAKYEVNKSTPLIELVTTVLAAPCTQVSVEANFSYLKLSFTKRLNKMFDKINQMYSKNYLSIKLFCYLSLNFDVYLN